MLENMWILVANSAKARVYLAHKAKLLIASASERDLILLKEYEHPESQKHDSELVSDHSGRYRSTANGSNTFDAPTDPKKYEENRFAQTLCKMLQSACHDKEFQELILVASPVFMGMLNKHISHDDNLQRLITTKIEKDYLKLNDRDLVIHLRKQL
ncbi:MAG: host attachment protein [Gammaproteobacteria bacterium]|nr:host attachment protein [Gammaproteobacteria bacterium]